MNEKVGKVMGEFVAFVLSCDFLPVAALGYEEFGFMWLCFKVFMILTCLTSQELSTYP
jgi:hypothetical protein